MVTHIDTAATPSQRIGQLLALLQEQLPILRRVVHAGESIYAAGDRLEDRKSVV